MSKNNIPEGLLRSRGQTGMFLCERRILQCRILFHLSCGFIFYRFPEQNKSNDKHHGQQSHSGLGGAEDLSGNSHQRSTDESGSFSENIIEPEILAGVLLWYDPGEVRP